MEDFNKVNEIFLQVLGIGIFGALGAPEAGALWKLAEGSEENAATDQK